jgi:hypothetical protein
MSVVGNEKTRMQKMLKATRTHLLCAVRKQYYLLLACHRCIARRTSSLSSLRFPTSILLAEK